MKITDQPGRVFAILIFSPLLIYKGIIYEDIILILFGILLFLWDLYWVMNYPPKIVEV